MPGRRKTPPGTPITKTAARANAAKSGIRRAVEHPFAHLNGLMGLVNRTVGKARAEIKIGLANLAFNMRRSHWVSTL